MRICYESHKKIINNLFSINENIDNMENNFKSKLINAIMENVIEDNISFMFEISLYLYDLYRNYVNVEFTEIRNNRLVEQENENTIINEK